MKIYQNIFTTTQVTTTPGMGIDLPAGENKGIIIIGNNV